MQNKHTHLMGIKPSLVSLAVAQALTLPMTEAATIEVGVPQDEPQIIIDTGAGDPIIIEICSLREAITSMNNAALEPGCVNTGGDFGINNLISGAPIAFNTSSELSITSYSGLTIDLAGGSITGAGDHRILYAKNSPNLVLQNLTISNGAIPGGEEYGAGLQFKNSTVTINNATISGNSVANTNGFEGGGGIAASYSSLTINNSTLTNNEAVRGGAISSYPAYALEINNSTISGNQAELGGAIFHGGAPLLISNSTVSANTTAFFGALVASSGATGTLSHTTFADNISDRAIGTAIYMAGYSIPGLESTITLSNSVLSGNGEACLRRSGNEPSNVIVDGGGNWFEDATCNGTAQGDPKLGVLADNGGATQTHLPLLISPLRDFVQSDCAVIDQRGNARENARCDAGAVEFVSAGITVNSVMDDGSGCTLREALASTSDGTLAPGCTVDRSFVGVDAQSIVIEPSLAGKTIVLNGTELTITNGQVVEINPEGVEGIVLDANKSSRALRVVNSTVSLNHLTITNGFYDSGTYSSGGGINGFASSLYIQNSTITGNSVGTVFTTQMGGGVYLRYGQMAIDSSTVSDNAAYYGGGIDVVDALLTMTNSTVSGNIAPGLFDHTSGLQVASPSAVINNSTIQNNMRALDIVGHAPIEVQNSIIDGHCFPAIINSGGNVFSDLSCAGQVDGDPALLPLADNGGPTKTHALAENSIARGAGNIAACSQRDQRGNIRDEGDGKCDAGSFEFVNSDAPVNFYVIPLQNGGSVVIPL